MKMARHVEIHTKIHKSIKILLIPMPVFNARLDRIISFGAKDRIM